MVFFLSTHEVIYAANHSDYDHHDCREPNVARVDMSACSIPMFKARCKKFGDIHFTHGYLPMKSSAKGLMVLGSIAGVLM